MASPQEINLVRAEKKKLESAERGLEASRLQIKKQEEAVSAQKSIVAKLVESFGVTEDDLAPVQRPVDAANSIKQGGARVVSKGEKEKK